MPSCVPPVGDGEHRRSRPLPPLEQLQRELRLSTLFCAFAAEAYVNAFLARAFDPQTIHEVDREPTPRKYLLGIERAMGRSELDPGAAPLRQDRAVQERDQIVHARPRRVKTGATGLRSDPFFIARSLIAVADCVLKLRDCLEDIDYMGPLETSSDLGDEIDVDLMTIEAERTYFFTGGLIHAAAKARKELEAIGLRLRGGPATTTYPPLNLVTRGRDLEAAAWR